MAVRDRLGLGEAFRTRWHIGLRAGLCVGVPLLAGVASGRPGWGALASLGGLAGFYGPDTPYPHRLRLVAGVGVALTVVVPLSGLCAPVAWLSVLFCGAVAGSAAFACLALRVPPPREYLIVLATLAATGIAASGTGVLRNAALVAAGALASGLVSLAPALGGRAAVPETRALEQAWLAVREVLSTAGTPGSAAARKRAVEAVGQAHEALRQAGPSAAEARLRSLAAAELALAGALSASVEAAIPLSPVAVRRVLGPAEAVLRGGGTVTGLDRPGIAARLRTALRPDSVAVPAAVRIAVTVAAAVATGRALGLDHSYWVALTAAAALQANNIAFLVRRSLHRLAGTVAGIALSWIVFATHPVLAMVAIVAMVAQFAGEVLIRAWYGLAMVPVTVVALSVYDLGVPDARIGAFLGARVLDTAIGVALVIVLRLVLWRRASVTRLVKVQAAALLAAAEVFRARWLGQPGESRGAARRVLEEDLLRMRALTEDAVGDRALGGRDTTAEQVSLAIDELAVLALGVPFARPLPPRPDAAALVGRLTNLAATLAGGAPDGVPVPTEAPLAAGIPAPVPELPGYPRTVAATELLTSAIADRAP